MAGGGAASGRRGAQAELRAFGGGVGAGRDGRCDGRFARAISESRLISAALAPTGASPVIAVFGGMDVQQGDAGLPALVLPGPPLLLPVQRQWRPVQSGRLLLFAPGDKAWSLPRTGGRLPVASRFLSPPILSHSDTAECRRCHITGGASPLPRFRHSATLCARGTADEAMLLWGGWRYPVGFQATPLEPFINLNQLRVN